MTQQGERSLLDYQALRIRGIADVLRNLPDEDQDDLSHLLEKLHTVLDRKNELVGN